MQQGRPLPKGMKGKWGLGVARECAEMERPGRPKTYEHMPIILSQDLGNS